jgi:hypothetical protein
MRKLFLALLICNLFFCSYAQTTEEKWNEMIASVQKEIDGILIEECPSDIDLTTYKQNLVKGENSLSDAAKEKIQKPMAQLVKYGQEFSVTKELVYEDESDLIIYAAFSPNTQIHGDTFTPGVAGRNLGLTWDEVVSCAGLALGVTAITQLGNSGASSWSMSSVKKAFKAVAKRMFGPIGVAIAVIQFGACLISEGFD